MTKVSLQSSGKRMVFYINSAGSTVIHKEKKINLNPYIAPYTHKNINFHVYCGTI